jgi:hypothetical protein
VRERMKDLRKREPFIRSSWALVIMGLISDSFGSLFGFIPLFGVWLILVFLGLLGL